MRCRPPDSYWMPLVPSMQPSLPLGGKLRLQIEQGPFAVLRRTDCGGLLGWQGRGRGGGGWGQCPDSSDSRKSMRDEQELLTRRGRAS